MNKNDNNNQNKFVKRTILVSAILLAVLIIVTIIGVKTWPQRTLNKIDRLIDKEKYISAEKLIEEYEEQIADTDLQKQKDKCNYYIAKDALTDGRIEDARYRFKNLEEYKDTKELLKECDYVEACIMMDAQEYDNAYALFLTLIGYKDTNEKLLSLRYAIAQERYTEGDIAKSLDMFLSLKNYEDSKDMADKIAMEVTGAKTIVEAYKILDGMNIEQMQKVAELTEIRDTLPNNVLAVGAYHTVGLKDDGTVLAAGLDDDGQCDVKSWSDIVAIDAGSYHTVGLTADGEVLAVGSNEQGQCDVEEWSDVVQVAAGAYNTYGLLEDGTVVSTGYLDNDIINDFEDIRQIGAGSYAVACIDKEGMILTTHSSLYINDADAIDADVSTGYIVALMPDGTVATSVKQISDWEDIIAISAGSNMILGIKSDGSVKAHFFNQRDKALLSRYDDVIAIAAGGAHSALLLSDGSVIAFGDNDEQQCGVGEWKLKGY